MTTDLLDTISYITVTAHFVHDWSLQSKIYTTKLSTDKNTGKHIADLVENIQPEFRTNKAECLVTMLQT